MRIAIITFGTPHDKKGAFNATHQRIKHLVSREINPDVFIIRYYENRLMQLLRRKKYQKQVKEEYFIYDDIRYNNLWVPLTLTDYFQWQKLNQLGSVFMRSAKRWSKLFAAYDLVSAHSLEPGIVAALAKEKYKVPFTVTWHGSDIHTMPAMNSAAKRMTLKICKLASSVFFVSKKLQSDAEALGIETANSEVLYNAVDRTQFKPYPPEARKNFKTQYKIDGTFNVSFAGGLVEVKNCQVLPELFKRISDKVKNVKFYFVGDGKMRAMLTEKCREYNLDVVFMGNRSEEDMPGILNCFDLVVLPSKNEGMPLIVLECIACQTPIITSRVGGIPELLGDEYTIPHGPDFVERYADAAISLVRNSGQQKIKLPGEFSWEQTSDKEATIYKRILNS